MRTKGAGGACQLLSVAQLQLSAHVHPDLFYLFPVSLFSCVTFK